MPRPRSAMPKYRYHVSGQAVVTLAGKDFYLGIHDSPESRSRYFALLAEYNANGKQAPEVETHQAEQPITVRCVTGEFREHAVTKYANNPQELNHSDALAESFGNAMGCESNVPHCVRVRLSRHRIQVAAPSQ